VYQAVEGRHCKACLLEGGFGRAVSGGEGAARQGLCLLEGNLGRACIRRWRGAIVMLVCWRGVWQGVYQAVEGRHCKACLF
jgi:hypothetical protein